MVNAYQLNITPNTEEPSNVERDPSIVRRGSIVLRKKPAGHGAKILGQVLEQAQHQKYTRN